MKRRRAGRGAAGARRRAGALMVSTVAALLAGPSSSARAVQSLPDVTLRLLDQTSWVTPHHPQLDLKVLAVNQGKRGVAHLSLGYTIYTPARSRTLYEETLLSEPDPSTFGTILASAPPVRGTLTPGASRTFDLSPIDLSVLAERGESAVYPLKVELRSQDEPVATIRSSVIFLDFPDGRARPLYPLRMSWAFVLDAPVMYGPDGVFDPKAVEDLLGPRGRFRREVGALDRLVSGKVPVPVDVVVAPTLLDQLADLGDGFRVRRGGNVEQVDAGSGLATAAATALTELKRIAASPYVELSATPLGSPNLAALVDSPLEGDVPTLLDQGAAEVERITGRAPNTAVFRPPGSHLDQLSLVEAWRHGGRYLLIDPSLVSRPVQTNEFAQPAMASLPVSLGQTATAAVPDQGFTSMLGSELIRSDPRVAAQALLGELAQIWLEQPGVGRGVGVMFPEDIPLPGALFAPLIQRIATAPWLQRERITRVAREFPPPSRPLARLRADPGPAFPSFYVNELLRDRRRIGVYRSMLVGPGTLPAKLDSRLLIAESGTFAEDPASGEEFLRAVDSRLSSEFSSIRLAREDSGRVVTLTSHTGVVPVSITNGSPDRLRVAVRLRSSHLDPLPGPPSQTVEIDGNSTLPLLFHVRARTTGTFPVEVVLTTPTGQKLSEGRVTVRSTAYNLIALIITIGAAVFLMLWWARRFLPSKRS